MKIIKRTEGISTTDIVGRLLLKQKTFEQPRKLSDPGKPMLSGEFITQVEEEEKKEFSRSPSEFLATARRLRQFSNNKHPKPTDKVVYIDGAFDIFHIGHISALKKAKEMGDFVIAGLHDD